MELIGRIILWNPSIRKLLTIPVKPNLILGFGVCNVTNDHKVVKVVYLEDSFNLTVPPQVEVYSLSTGSWRSVSATAPSCYMSRATWSQVFVFGSVHWIASYDENGGQGRNLVVSFDMGNEVFRELMFPDSLANVYMPRLCITVLGDSFAALYCSEISGQEFCCVWVMKEYGVAESWTKLFTVSNSQRLRTLGFRKDGQVILPLRNSELVSYDPET